MHPAKPLGVLSRHPCRKPKPLPLGERQCMLGWLCIVQSLWAYTPGVRAGAECGAVALTKQGRACCQSHTVAMQGSIKTATQSRCTMQRHKWLSLHRCNGTNGCHCTDATTLTVDNLHGSFAPQPRLGLLCGINGVAAPRPCLSLRPTTPIGFNSVLNIQN